LITGSDLKELVDQLIYNCNLCGDDSPTHFPYISQSFLKSC